MTDIADVFARLLRTTREREGLSQVDLARQLSDRLGVSVFPTVITKIEKREREVKIDEAVALAEVLDVPLAALLSERDPIDARLEELRRELEKLQWRENRADTELRQAMVAVANLELEIAALEASRDR